MKQHRAPQAKAVPFVLLIFLVTAPPASARLDPCTRVLGKTFHRYVQRRWHSIDRCERQKLRGELADTTNCRPAVGAVTDPKTANRLEEAATRLRAKVEGRCTLALPPLGPACNGAQSGAELADCLTAAAQEPDTSPANVDTLIETIYAAGGFLQDLGPRTCIEQLSRAAGSYLRRRMRASRRCALRAASRRSAGPCPDTRAQAVFTVARSRFQIAVRKSCRSSDLGGDAPIVFGIPCEQYRFTIYRRSQKDGISNRIDAAQRLVRCMSDAAAAVADKMESIPFPGTDTSAFDSGVAAGDATDSSIVFWTRLPDPTAGAFLDIASDPDLTGILQSVAVTAVAGRDGTVKVDVGGLSPASSYYYRFRQGAATSTVGRVRTAPAPTDAVPVRFGWTGDANAFFQPFTVLDVLRKEDLDAWFFIGDTIYGDEPRADGLIAMTTADYLDKYSHNRADASLRSLTASTGTYVQWDDHEVLNDFSGAVPAFADRMAAGNLAFRSYHPIREDPGDPMQLFRSFQWGTAVEFFLIDDRQYRSAEIVCCNPPDPPVRVIDTDVGLFGECPLGGQRLLPDATCNAALADPSRTFLGVAQKAWLKNSLMNSTATFKFIMNGPPITELRLQPYDRWEAYPAERSEILDFIETNNIKNVIWLSTDLHAILVSPERVDVAQSHFVPEIVAGPIGIESIFRQIALLSPDVVPLVPLFPNFFPQVSEFDIDRFNVVVITVDPSVSPAKARFDFLDRTGAVVSSLSYSAAL